ncbi:molybdopterin-dependent oxidoreductase [Nakamurella sp. PAMC28650]|uniref:molybdopterin-dependent oxidoreductase n=1 Tax=Nakamurella sp. PAMC28650 TaxID=2762325 RepID=UPI002103D20E|nr:molybdopterin-dependent oxidoreductase [Nakamurella sp. PAMC28650]
MTGRGQLGPYAHAVLGVVSVGLAAAFAELLAAAGQWMGLLRTASSPANALGEWFITITPQWLKNWAISEFGTRDKQALLVGMALTVTITAVLIGLLARIRISVALAVSGVLVAGALAAVLSRADSRLIDAVPAVLGALVGLLVLSGGGRIARAHAVRRPSHVAAVPRAVASGPETRAAVATTAAAAEAAVGAGRVPVAAQTGRVTLHRRRQFVRLMTFGAVVAAASGALSRLIPSASEVEASRARIAIPLPGDSQPINSGGATPASTATSPLRQSASASFAGQSAIAPSSSAASSSAPSTSAPSTSAPSTSHGSAAPEPTTTASTTPSSAASRTASRTAATGSTTSVEFPAIQGLSPFVTPTADFYRIDTALSPPLIRAEDWSLRIHGLVQQEVRLNYFALMAEPQVERSITLTCVSNPVGGHLVDNATWIGVRIDRLLQRAGLLPGADCVLSTSIDGFTSTTPLSALTDGRDALLAVAMNGAPLPIAHGFPVRMVVPGLYGYVSATKWLVDLQVTTFAKDSSYWTSRGYAEQAPVKMSSRIDVPAPYTPYSAGDLVTIAGMAWAQHDGISAVQVQVDNGSWHPADLAGQLSIDTWRQWRHQWKATRGSHIVRCRAVDTAGVVQDSTAREVLPDGATGYASLVLMVT